MPEDFNSALLDDHSIASFFWRCRPDVHDNICDFTTVKPPPYSIPESETLFEVETPSRGPLYTRMMIIDTTHQKVAELDAVSFADGTGV